MAGEIASQEAAIQGPTEIDPERMAEQLAKVLQEAGYKCLIWTCAGSFKKVHLDCPE